MNKTTKTATIAISSTNIDIGTTTTTTTTLPPTVMDLPSEERNKEAAKMIFQRNESIKDIQDQILDIIGSLLEGKQESTFIKKGPLIAVVNITGNYNRINWSSYDESVNAYNITPETVFNELRKTISETLRNSEECSKIISAINEMEEAKGTSDFTQKYTGFISLVANHITIISPFLPVLTQWLGLE